MIIWVAEEGTFELNGSEYCMRKVRKGGKTKSFWKCKVGIKLEDGSNEVKSIMDWFDETELRPIYERNKKQMIILLFAEDLYQPCLADRTQSFMYHNEQEHREERFDTTCCPDLR